MNTEHTYFVILAAALAGPMALSFDKKVAFYKQWKYLFPAMILPALLYITWDVYFTSIGIWSFNPSYITGVKIINLPIEEILFFFVVPYCCVFIYECIRIYFPRLTKKRWADVAMQLLGVILLLTGIYFYRLPYTSWTFVACAFFTGALYVFKKSFPGFSASLFLVAFAVVLIPFLVVNGFLTALPVVMYNDAANTGIRIYTIPFEDVFYGMLLFLLNIVIFEKLRQQSVTGQAHPI